MKKILNLILCISLVTFMSCYDDDEKVPTDSLVGTWKIESTSGGITGAGYNPNFDELIIESDSSFILQMGTDIIADGVLKKLDSTQEFPYRLILGTRNTQDYIDLIDDNEKDITVEDNVMNILAPCCDRYNTRLERE